MPLTPGQWRATWVTEAEGLCWTKMLEVAKSGWWGAGRRLLQKFRQEVSATWRKQGEGIFKEKAQDLAMGRVKEVREGRY